MKRVLSIAAAALLASTTLSLAQTVEGDAEAEGSVTVGDETTTDTATEMDTATDPGTTASINLSAEQQTEMRTILSEDASPVDADFEISIGAMVPDTVTVQPLPPRFVEVVPEYEGYRYFVLADGRIVIVQPDTLEVVYIMS